MDATSTLSEADAGCLARRALRVATQRAWSLRWDARLAQSICENAEFAEAVRGKRGNKTEEAGDMLLAMMIWTEAADVPWSDVVAAAERKCAKLEVAPRYAGEQFEVPGEGASP